MGLRNLYKGENVGLPEDVRRLQFVVTWNDPFGDREVDASALLLNAEHRVRSDTDFVFYNQPVSPGGAVRHLGKTGTDEGFTERLTVDLDTISDDVISVAATASIDRGHFGDLSPLRLMVIDSAGEPVVRYDICDATVETAIVLGEVYRRAGGWKVRAVGQGWSTGLAGLATDFGVNVDDGDPETATDTDTTTTSETPESPTDTPDRAPCRATRARAVRTRKPKPVKAPIPRLTLADDDTWQATRLFSIYGVGGTDEQEQRATSALLATMIAVRPFARGITARLGAPAGTLETYVEVPFDLGERKLRPDGVIRTARAGRIWTALVEVKTGSNQLRHEQVGDYLSIAKAQGFDAVVTISNDICPGVGEHPIPIDKRKLRNVALIHLSWAEILHEAKMVLTHRGVADPLQAWLLAELIRYLEHPRSGACGLTDMGAGWTNARDAVATGTFRASDRHSQPVAEAWLRLVRSLCLRLTADLGATVAQVIPRKLATDPTARTQAVMSRLATDGLLDASLRIPGLSGPMTVSADLRTSVVRVGIAVPAQDDGGARRRVTALLRQLGEEAPADLLVEAHFAQGGETSCEQLGDIRNNPGILLQQRNAEIISFQLSRATPMGTKRSGIRGAFIPSVTDAVDGFHQNVIQRVRPLAGPPGGANAPATTSGTGPEVDAP